MSFGVNDHNVEHTYGDNDQMTWMIPGLTSAAPPPPCAARPPSKAQYHPRQYGKIAHSTPLDMVIFTNCLSVIPCLTTKYAALLPRSPATLSVVAQVEVEAAKCESSLS